jgi:hypothetical protein
MDIINFLQELLPAQKKVPFFKANIEGLYNYIESRPRALRKCIVFLKNKTGVFMLIVWKIFISAFEDFFWSQYCKKKNFKFVIIFTFDSPSNYESQLKIAQELNKREIDTLVITTKKLFKAKIKKLSKLKHCSFIFLDQKTKNLPIFDYIKAKKRARFQINDVLSVTPNKKLKNYKNFIELNLQKQNVLASAYTQIFSELRAKAVIANNFGGGLLEAIRKTKMKSITIQHGAISKTNLPGYQREENELIVWGEYWRDIYRDRISKATKITVLGCPRFDDIVMWKNQEKTSSFYKTLNIDSRKNTVAFFSSSHGGRFSADFYKSIILSLLKVKQNLKDKINLIIRLHQGRETPALYRQALIKNDFDSLVFSPDTMHLYEILRHAEIAISISSTTLLESMALELAAIQFNPQEELKIIEYSKEGGGVLARTQEELEQTINKLISDEKYRQFIINQQSLYLSDKIINLGTATQKIVNYLLKSNDNSEPKP